MHFIKSVYTRTYTHISVYIFCLLLCIINTAESSHPLEINMPNNGNGITNITVNSST